MDAIDTTRPGPLRRFISHPLVLLPIGCALVMAAWLGTAVPLQMAGLTRGAPAALSGVFVATVTIAVYRAFVRWIERGRDGDLPFDGTALPEAAKGFGYGLALFCGAVLAVMALGGLRIEGGSGSVGDLSQIVGLAVFSGVTEELFFRGVMFRFIERAGGSIVALIITSALFGAAHIANPDSTWAAALAIMLEAGVMLAAIYMLTRNLWTAIGLHAGWNFTQGYVFSLPVSGGTAPNGLLVTTRSGPEWLTGGAFGLEASLATVVVVTLFGLVVLAQAVRRGRLVPMRGARAAQDALNDQTTLANQTKLADQTKL